MTYILVDKTTSIFISKDDKNFILSYVVAVHHVNIMITYEKHKEKVVSNANLKINEVDLKSTTNYENYSIIGTVLKTFYYVGQTFLGILIIYNKVSGKL